jgi:hypothetical protein
LRSGEEVNLAAQSDGAHRTSGGIIVDPDDAVIEVDVTSWRVTGLPFEKLRRLNFWLGWNARSSTMLRRTRYGLIEADHGSNAFVSTGRVLCGHRKADCDSAVESGLSTGRTRLLPVRFAGHGVVVMAGYDGQAIAAANAAG